MSQQSFLNQYLNFDDHRAQAYMAIADYEMNENVEITKMFSESKFCDMSSELIALLKSRDDRYNYLTDYQEIVKPFIDGWVRVNWYVKGIRPNS